MNNKRYPISLFLFGLLMNILLSWLFLPGLILSIIGLFAEPCLYIGQALLWIDIAFSLIKQIRIRQAFLEENDNPDFQELQDDVSRDGSWHSNILDFVGRRISEQQNKDQSNQEDKEKDDKNDE